MSTKAEKRHMGRVASLGCYLCRQLGYGETPAQVHHVREGQGMAQRAKGSKLDAEAFGLVTGWEGKSNQHERDGAMVAWQYRMAGG